MNLFHPHNHPTWQCGRHFYFTSGAWSIRLAPGHMGFYVAELGSGPLQSGSVSVVECQCDALPLCHADAHVMRGLQADGPGWV